ncbi:MAG: hypothetical protein HW416_3995, partial [Chloroflexi bacterium]|nr:hypothetical protein [Chloroflexota bacterium]
MAEVEGLTHTGPVALSLVESEAFYARVLGARLVNRNHFDSDNAPRGRSLHTVMTVADYMLTPMLPFDAIPMPAAELRRGINNFRSAFAVSTARFSDVVTHLRQSGIPFDGPLAHPEQGPLGESVYLQDPGGNFLEICWRRDEADLYHSIRLPERLANFRPEPAVEGLVPVHLLCGAVIEVSDLAATRAFYTSVLRDTRGTWEEGEDCLAFACGAQRIEFTQRDEPRTFSGRAHHYAFRVAPDRLRSVADELAAS